MVVGVGGAAKTGIKVNERRRVRREGFIVSVFDS
jgi:hypothetical protein